MHIQLHGNAMYVCDVVQYAFVFLSKFNRILGLSLRRCLSEKSVRTDSKIKMNTKDVKQHSIHVTDDV